MTESWQHLGSAQDNPMGVEWFGVVMGLGFVLSFGYWCTDFLVVQRAMAAKSMTPRAHAADRRLPQDVHPLHRHRARHDRPRQVGDAGRGSGGRDYDQVLPMLMEQFYPTGMLGVGLTALMASFMSGMAGNVTAFNTVWTYDIYQSYIKPGAADSHYLWMGRHGDRLRRAGDIGAAYVASRSTTSWTSCS